MLLPRVTQRHPTPPSSTLLLREINVSHFGQRFDACVAAAATVWGYGYQLCRTPMEQKAWMDAYFEHLDLLCSTRSTIQCWPDSGVSI